MPDFLLEIGTEEIPARMIGGAAEDLSQRVADLVSRNRLAGVKFETFSTPRRLAVMATGIAREQAFKKEQLTGPPISIAYKDGMPTPAADAFAKKVGSDLSQMHRIATPKGEYLAAWVETPGRSAAEIFAESLPKEIADLLAQKYVLA